jgi:hypothetical protein
MNIFYLQIVDEVLFPSQQLKYVSLGWIFEFIYMTVNLKKKAGTYK